MNSFDSNIFGSSNMPNNNTGNPNPNPNPNPNLWNYSPFDLNNPILNEQYDRINNFNQIDNCYNTDNFSYFSSKNILPNHLNNLYMYPPKINYPAIYPNIYPAIYPNINPNIYPAIYPVINPNIYPAINPTINPNIYPTINPAIYPTNNPTNTQQYTPSIISENNKKQKNKKQNKKNNQYKKNNIEKNKNVFDKNITNILNNEKKPILIIRKIKKEDNIPESNSLGSMLNSLFSNEEVQKEKGTESINYLEDSDDENDNLITIEQIKCDEEFKNKKRELFSNIKIIPLNEIIHKDNISSIDDLITIGNYYEQRVIYGKESTINETVANNETAADNETVIDNETVAVNETATDNETVADNETNSEEFKLIESIIKNLGIPITSTKFIINNKTKVLSSSNKIEKIEKDKTINNGENCMELYKIGEDYFTINLEKVYKMRGYLIKLKKMIGLANIKSEIIDMVLYYLMEFEKTNNNMLHMTLEGSPGCGKTKLAKIISKLLGAMGILDNNKVVYARRTDMIGQYLGQTGQKTQQVINSALGGVLFIDEAYSLGSSKKDIYSKECLDILNQNLSDNKKKLVCIIAGYHDELEKYFFSSNPGLTRRFPFRFRIIDYTHNELLNIFINKINKLNWKLDKNANLEEFFEKNISHFKFFGGDIDTFIQDIKYTHSRRVICNHPCEFKIITKNDIKIAFEKFKNRRVNSGSEVWKNMFV